ncbi:MAG TPA: tetratricopeptide repeat protein [Candidatus Binatia bacterium]|jgi:tetratricopeptide (TPR) repeat protein|nr:tetratricopeptide repeat protein [Candidatus Binatia bacterium]
MKGKTNDRPDREFRWLAFVLSLTLSAGATAQPAQTNLSETHAPSAPGQPQKLSFNKEIAPIVFEHCSMCHRPGQAAPFSLLSYTDVKKRARQVAEVTGKRFMPPWLPEKGYGEFAGDRSLRPDQIEAIRRWVADGAEEGAAADLPPLPRWTEDWMLGKPDLIVKLPQPYSLAPEGKDVYRDVVVPIPTTERKIIKGVEFLPGNWKVLHHAFINIDPTRVSRRLAEKENPPGFNGMALPETAVMPGGQTLGWQPGKVPSFSPEGLGWVLETNTDLVLQLHLHPSGKPELVQPAVAFYFAQTAPTNSAFRINLNPLLIDIPAGQSDYVIEDKYLLPIDVDLLSVYPHAHYIARRMEGYALLADGRRQDLLLIKDWDFNWQGDYRYAKPIFLPRGTTLGMRFTYDNSAGNVRNPNHPPRRVKYGLQTTDEMAELWFQVLPRIPYERALLAQGFFGHLAEGTIAYNEAVIQENPNDAEAHVKVGRGRLFLGQMPAALEQFRAAVKTDPKYDKGWYDLGFLLLNQQHFDEARDAFEHVVKLNPDDYQALGNLGNIYMQKGDLNQAEANFRAALRLNPDDRVARGNLDLVLTAKAKAGK